MARDGFRLTQKSGAAPSPAPRPHEEESRGEQGTRCSRRPWLRPHVTLSSRYNQATPQEQHGRPRPIVSQAAARAKEEDLPRRGGVHKTRWSASRSAASLSKPSRWTLSVASLTAKVRLSERCCEVVRHTKAYSIPAMKVSPAPIVLLHRSKQIRQL